MIEFRNTSRAADSSAHAKLEQSWNKILEREEIGFTRITERTTDWNAMRELRARDGNSVTEIVVLGIGGSSLGTQVVYEAFRKNGGAKMIFLESPDPAAWELSGASQVDWAGACTVIVSKSGATLETLSWVEMLNEKIPGGIKNTRLSVVASPGAGPLQKWAEREGVPCLWIPQNVGGRFSVLTAAGMWPACLMGLDIEGFRKGAAWALTQTSLATRVSAEVLASWQRGEWITQMWTYSEELKMIGEWWQQLWSESLGKKSDRAGKSAPRVSSPMACRGPRDQHSQVQQLVEAPGDKYVLVNRLVSAESLGRPLKPSLFPELPVYGRRISLNEILGAEAESFERSLTESRVPFSTLTMQKIDEAHLGAYFMLWQMIVAQLGEYLGINAFDQPGVEIGKRHAYQILSRGAAAPGQV